MLVVRLLALGCEEPFLDVMIDEVPGQNFVARVISRDEEVGIDKPALARGGLALDRFQALPDFAGQLAIFSAEARQDRTDPAIAAVQNRQAQTNEILSATRVIKITMALLAALLVFASILLISNTIRLSLFSRRREVEVMKLVGATDWFIRWPFVLEGLFLGAVGGAAAIGLLALAKVTLVDPLANTVKLISQPDMIAFPLLVAILMGCAIAVSAAGSGISLRRFLRV